MSEITALIEIGRLSVHNANAVSGPLSWGFPAPSAFMGFVHALNRQLDDVQFGGVGIICHQFDPQVAKSRGSYTHSFKLMRHPYKASWRQKPFQVDKQSAMIEEGRAHLEVTLLIELLGDEPRTEDERNTLSLEIQALVSSMRIAGGALHQVSPKVEIHNWPETEENAQKEFRHKRYRWLPGFALVERRDLLCKHLEGLRQNVAETNSLEAMLDLLAIHSEPELTDEPYDKIDLSAENTDRKSDSTVWVSTKRSPGWLVPLPVGYGALSELYKPGSVRNARDRTVPFRFVESLYSIGQWLSPHRLTSINQLLWHTESDAKYGLYLCRNYYQEK